MNIYKVPRKITSASAAALASFCCVAKAWPLAWCPVWPYSSRSGVLGLCRGGAAETEREEALQ